MEQNLINKQVTLQNDPGCHIDHRQLHLSVPFAL